MHEFHFPSKLTKKNDGAKCSKKNCQRRPKTKSSLKVHMLFARVKCNLERKLKWRNKDSCLSLTTTYMVAQDCENTKCSLPSMSEKSTSFLLSNLLGMKCRFMPLDKKVVSKC